MTNPKPFIPPTQTRTIRNTRDRLVRLERYPTPTILQIKVFSDTQTVVVGDGALIFVISDDLEGLALIKANAFVSTASSAGDLTIQLRNLQTGNDILTVPITIPANSFTSYPPATPSEVDPDPSVRIVATGDLIAIDVDASGAGAKGLGVVLTTGVPLSY